MLVVFHGSHDMGLDVGDGRVVVRGGKLGRDGGHPIEQRAEQELCVEPCERRVVAIVGQLVEAAERLPSFELQLDLPAKAISLEAALRVESSAGRGGE